MAPFFRVVPPETRHLLWPLVASLHKRSPRSSTPPPGSRGGRLFLCVGCLPSSRPSYTTLQADLFLGVVPGLYPKLGRAPLAVRPRYTFALARAYRTYVASGFGKIARGQYGSDGPRKPRPWNITIAPVSKIQRIFIQIGIMTWSYVGLLATTLNDGYSVSVIWCSTVPSVPLHGFLVPYTVFATENTAVLPYVRPYHYLWESCWDFLRSRSENRDI